MEAHKYSGKNSKSSIEEEESSLLERLIALKKQLEVDDEPKLLSTKTLYSTEKNILTNDYVVSSKSKYRKVNNHNVNKFLSTKIDNRNRIKTQNNLFIKTNCSSSKVPVTTSSLNLVPHKSKTVVSKTNPEIVKNNHSTEKYNLEINEIVKNSLVNNGDLLLNATAGDSKSFLATIDNYMLNVQNYLNSSKYVVNKVDNILSINQTSNPVKNVHVNRKFQDQLISNRLLDSNSRTSNSLITSKNIITKKKPIKRLSEQCTELPRLVKIGNTKLIRQSLIKNKNKFNNTININRISNNKVARKPLSILQCPTSNTLITSCNKSKWTKATNHTPALSPKLLKPINTNMLKWTKPNLLLVNNLNKNNQHIVQQSDKLILFGKNKIIRQSLISSIQSKKQNYFHKHFTHRFALLRKLQGKILVKGKNRTMTNDLIKNLSLSRKTSRKAVDEIKKNRNRSHSMYSYVNPKLRLNTNSNYCLKKVGSSNINVPSLCNKSKNLKVVNNDKNKILNLNLSNNQTFDRTKGKKTFTKQLCLVFNRFGVCSKLDQGLCDKRHYKKYIILCNKFLIGECNNESCKLSHIISEEKIPFCKHYLNNICVKLNCPYLHEYRNSKTPICKNFLHGYCTLGKKCSKKHLNLCPIIESKNKCPHGQKCLYPHNQSEEKKAVDDEVYEPRYFERLIPYNEESKENKSYHIVPKRHAPLTDLPSYIPL